jgi:hypothetical protein
VKNDPAVSEIIGTILIIALVIALAGIIAALTLGLVGKAIPESTFAPFKVEVGRDGHSSGPVNNSAYLTVYQMAGDNLRLGKGAVNTTPLLNTTFQLVGPDGVNHQVVTPVNPWLTGEDIGKGQAFYIFLDENTGDYRIVNNKDRIYSASNLTSLQKGNWRLVISDIKDAKMVIGQYPFTV